MDVPPEEKAATSKTRKRPRDTPDSQSDDDLEHSVTQSTENVTIVISDDSASSDQDEQQARESIQKMLQEIQGDITESYFERRKQFEQDIKSTTELLNDNLLSAFKVEQRARQLLSTRYSQMFGPLFQQWERDVLKFEQEENRFVNAANQHAKILEKCVIAQKKTIDEAEKISVQFLKNIKDLEDNHRRLDAIEQEAMQREIENLKMKLTTEDQHRDLRAIETCLHSLLSEDYKEKL
ncbi:Synaptonemal complex protein 3 [Lemmus lemmus]